MYYYIVLFPFLWGKIVIRGLVIVIEFENEMADSYLYPLNMQTPPRRIRNFFFFFFNYACKIADTLGGALVHK